MDWPGLLYLTYLIERIKKTLSLDDFLYQLIQYLDNHPNSTKRGFGPLILEEDLNLMDGP